MNQTKITLIVTLTLSTLLTSALANDNGKPLKPIPDKLVVLTFDDGLSLIHI